MGRAVITYFRMIYCLTIQRQEQQPQADIVQLEDVSEPDDDAMDVDQEESDEISNSETS